jgi:hypothetical protein
MGASAYCDSAAQSWWRCISSACCRRPVADRQDPGPCCACACFNAGMADLLHGRGGGALLANWPGPSRQSALIRICSTDLDLFNLFLFRYVYRRRISSRIHIGYVSDTGYATNPTYSCIIGFVRAQPQLLKYTLYNIFLN